MSNINGIYEKLKKLARLSSDTIDEFGFKYFITAAISEFKKKGFTVFQPEFEQAEIKYSESQVYKTWLHEHSITSESESKNKEQLKIFTQKPKMLLAISILKFDKNHLKKTLDSLNEQIYDNFEIRLYHLEPNKIPPEVIHDLSHTLKKDFKIEIKPINDILTQDCDFVIFMKSGDILTKDALFRLVETINKIPDVDIIYSDEEQIDGDQCIPFFKPDWAPDLFLSFDYISNFYIVRTELLKKIGSFRQELDHLLHYDFLLRLTEITEKIVHIPTILVSIKVSFGGVPLASIEAYGKKALDDALKRRGINAKVTDGLIRKTFRIKYSLIGEPKVSIIIPTRDQKALLKRCITSIEAKTSYKNYEIIIMDNNSSKEETISYLKSLPYTVIKYDAPFNFSRINNIASTHASGEYLLFLNDDTAALKDDWLSEMVSIAQQKNIGVVGPKLVFAGNLIQHAGLVMLKTGAGFHPFSGFKADESGYFGFLNVIRNYSAVTGACLLIKKKLFTDIGGFDERLDLYYQDADLCLKAIESGYRIVYTPYAVLLHQGSSTIKEHARSFFAVENHYQFLKKWPRLREGDPFYNPNLGWNYRISTKYP